MREIFSGFSKMVSILTRTNSIQLKKTRVYLHQKCFYELLCNGHHFQATATITFLFQYHVLSRVPKVLVYVISFYFLEKQKLLITFKFLILPVLSISESYIEIKIK